MALTETTTAAATESAKLQRHFGRFDILFFLVCTIVGVDTIASIAGAGGEAFTWTLIYAVIFFVPQALLFAELGTAFPQEGGPYLWTRLAFGRLAGAVNNFLYWVTNPVWIGGSLAGSCVGAVALFFTGNDSLSTPMMYVVSLVFVWITILTAIASFRVGKWVPTAGAFARFLLLGLFTISVILYGVKHGAQGLSHVSDYKPSMTGFVLLIGLLLFNYVGFELPNSAGEEMVNPQRDVPFAIARSAVGSVILYCLPVAGILIALPPSAISNFSGFATAIQDVFTVYGGSVTSGGASLTGGGLVLGDLAAILFIICLVTSGATWIMGSDRALAVSCYDGAGPRFLGVISARFGTPVRVNVFSGILSSVVVVLGELITQGNAAKYFDAVLGIAISTTLISYLLIYPAVWKLRSSYPDVARPFRMPWMKPLTVLLVILVAVATVQLIAPGAGYHWFSSAFAPSGWDYGERSAYLLTELIPVLAFIVIGVLFWWLGRGTRAQIVELEALSADQTAPELAD